MFTGLIKAHKEDYQLRIITTGCSTAIEHLSAFTEYYSAPLACKHSSYIKDTTHRLNKTNRINQTRSFPPGTLQATWHIKAMFPNIDNKAGFKNNQKTFDSHPIQSPSKKCLMESVNICLENNNAEFEGQHYIQTNGTTMGPKNSCSYSDITMTEVDQVATSQGPYKPEQIGIDFVIMYSIFRHMVLKSCLNLQIF